MKVVEAQNLLIKTEYYRYSIIVDYTKIEH